MRYYLVTSPKDTDPRCTYASCAHAEAKAALLNIEAPMIGPWSVIELAPVVSEADVDAVVALMGEQS
jgi:hypothetical protein